MDIPLSLSGLAPQAYRVPDTKGRDFLPGAYQGAAPAARGWPAATSPAAGCGVRWNL